MTMLTLRLACLLEVREGCLTEKHYKIGYQLLLLLLLLLLMLIMMMTMTMMTLMMMVFV